MAETTDIDKARKAYDRLKKTVDGMRQELETVQGEVAQRVRPAINLDILAQDITSLEIKLADVNKQITRMNRLIRVDEREAAVGEQQSRTELINAVSTNTRAVNSLVTKLAEDGDKDFDYYQYLRNKQRVAKAARIAETRKLRQMEQEIVDTCPEGHEDHKGLAFLRVKKSDFDDTPDEKEVVVTLCPRVWWFRQSAVSFEDGRLTQFTGSTPLSKYMRTFRKK